MKGNTKIMGIVHISNNKHNDNTILFLFLFRNMYNKPRHTDLKFHITELASAARPLDLEHRVSFGVFDGEPRVDEGAVLLDEADGGPRRRLNLHLLQAAEATPGRAAEGSVDVNDLKGASWEGARPPGWPRWRRRVKGCGK